MNQTDLAIGIGGVSAPLWLTELNAYVALVVGIMSIIYLGIKIWQSRDK